MQGWEIANIVIPVAGMATGVILLVTLGRLIRHWVDRHYDRTGGGGELLTEIERLRTEVQGTRELEERVLELEERVDFAERLLTQHQAAPQILPKKEG